MKKSAQSEVTRLPPRRRRAALTRSEMMARIRSKDTMPEVLVRAGMHALGLRFRKHARNLPGNPDLANHRNAWAIFVHGCFWHSHMDCRLASRPKSNFHYWGPKLQRNIERDRIKVQELRRLGYRVLVIWECETRKPARLAALLNAFARKLRAR